MIVEIANELDAWVVARNVEAMEEGMLVFRPCRIRVLGQMGLLEMKSSLHLAATKDVDVYADYAYSVKMEFVRLLAIHGMELDPVGHEIWMPQETVYKTLFAGEYVTMQVADIDAILLSKALKAPAKNKVLIVEYLASGASERFFELATRYGLDLERFV